jgi:hypothetical protein
VVRVSLEENGRINARKCNVVVFGLSENETTEADLKAFHKLCKNELNCNVESMSCRRLGKRSDDSKLRPLLVLLKSEAEKRKVLMNAKLLKNYTTSEAKRIFIAPDMSKGKREAQKLLREEKKRRQKNGEQNLQDRGDKLEQKNP